MLGNQGKQEPCTADSTARPDITVCYFGILGALAAETDAGGACGTSGGSSESWPVDAGHTLRSLLTAHIPRRHGPRLAALLPRCMVAVNGEVVWGPSGGLPGAYSGAASATAPPELSETPLLPGDEIALLPPFSGG